jgi:hypothetical protein
MNKAKAEQADTEPIQLEEISAENIILENPITAAEVNNETEVLIEPAEADKPMELPMIRDELSRKANETFMQPGWLHIQITHSDLINPDDFVVVPESGQILSNRWTLDDWYHITEERNIAAVYSKKQMLDGTQTWLHLLSDGSIWQAVQPDLLPEVTMNTIMNTRIIDRIIAFGDDAHPSVRFEDQDGIEVIAITTVDKLHEPVSYDGINQFILEAAVTYYYDWNTGQFLYREDWFTLDDGTLLLANKTELKAFLEDEAPDEVLNSFN